MSWNETEISSFTDAALPSIGDEHSSAKLRLMQSDLSYALDIAPLILAGMLDVCDEPEGLIQGNRDGSRRRIVANDEYREDRNIDTIGDPPKQDEWNTGAGRSTQLAVVAGSRTLAVSVAKEAALDVLVVIRPLGR